MKRTTSLVSSGLTLLVLAISGCSAGAGSAAEPGSSTDDLTDSITEADIEAAGKLQQIFIVDPKLTARAKAKLIHQSAFDGTSSSTVLVKDADGRLFNVYSTSSDPKASALAGNHGAPPAFADTRFFLLLNPKGVDWAIADHPTAPSTRHAQILGMRDNPEFADDVTELGTTPSGATILHFNAALFLVAPAGFDDRCKSDAEDCSSHWQRVVNFEDPFDAQ